MTSLRITLSVQKHRETGLLAATSDDLNSLLVVGRTIEELIEQLPASIRAMMRLEKKQDVQVLGVEIDESEQSGWADYEPRKVVATYEFVAHA
jgi:hypothetical protein